MNGRVGELIMRFSTVQMILDSFHTTFRELSLETQKRYEAYRIGVFSCKQKANLIVKTLSRKQKANPT